MGLKVILGDITKIKADAIVNAANNRLKMGTGVCGAIFNAAGKENLQEQCNKITYCKTGSAVVTDAFNLDAKYIIHTVGPVWQGGNQNEEQLLYNAYNNCLNLADRHRCKSIAFPLISSGVYGYPIRQAIEVAVKIITGFIETNDISVYLVLFDKSAYQTYEDIISAN